MFSLFRCKQCLDAGCDWSQNVCSWATTELKNVRIHVFIIYIKVFTFNITYVVYVYYYTILYYTIVYYTILFLVAIFEH